MIGERLNEARKDRGITQTELAEYLSVSVKTISSYETDRSKPDDENKIKIARFFNISLDYFLGLINEPLPFERSGNAVFLPKCLQTESGRKDVERYIAFLEHEHSQNAHVQKKRK